MTDRVGITRLRRKISDLQDATTATADNRIRNGDNATAVAEWMRGRINLLGDLDEWAEAIEDGLDV